jgi:hypothetical protein
MLALGDPRQVSKGSAAPLERVVTSPAAEEGPERLRRRERGAIDDERADADPHLSSQPRLKLRALLERPSVRERHQHCAGLSRVLQRRSDERRL